MFSPAVFSCDTLRSSHYPLSGIDWREYTLRCYRDLLRLCVSPAGNKAHPVLSSGHWKGRRGMSHFERGGVSLVRFYPSERGIPNFMCQKSPWSVCFSTALVAGRRGRTRELGRLPLQAGQSDFRSLVFPFQTVRKKTSDL